MASIRLTSARTKAIDSDAAAKELVEGLGAPPKLALMFASSERDQVALNRAVRALLPASTRLVGATSSGEIDRDGTHTGTVVLAGLTGDFEIGVGLGTGLSLDGVDAGQMAM